MNIQLFICCYVDFNPYEISFWRKHTILFSKWQLRHTLNKIINTTLLFLPHFSWAELKALRLFLCTQKAYFSQILFTNLSKSVLVNEIIHPPHRCGILRCWLNTMIITQVCLRLDTIKGHSKMFYHTAQCHRCRKFWGSVQLACWLQECPPELLPVNWMLISLP